MASRGGAARESRSRALGLSDGRSRPRGGTAGRGDDLAEEMKEGSTDARLRIVAPAWAMNPAIARLGAAQSRNLKRDRHPEAGAAEFGQRGGEDRAWR